MSLIIEEINKPISKLAAKVDSETPFIQMECPELPERYRDKALKNLCIVSLAKIAEKSKGGIILTPSAKEATEYASQIGRIEAVGPLFYEKKRWGDGAINPPKVGEFVYFAPYTGRRFTLNDEDYMFLEDRDILMRDLDPSDHFKIYT
jgi:co-chaperonin GroES (HSP10)